LKNRTRYGVRSVARFSHTKPSLGVKAKANTSTSKVQERVPSTRLAKKTKTRTRKEGHEVAMHDVADESHER
jgi:hypothetical protein